MEALIAAIESSGWLAIASVASASVASIATITPPWGSSPISLARALTNLTASGKESTEAIWAAAISPIECPQSSAGRRPQLLSSR